MTRRPLTWRRSGSPQSTARPKVRRSICSPASCSAGTADTRCISNRARVHWNANTLTCGRYRNRIRTGEVCTTHYIRKSVLKELVLGDIQRVLSYVKAHEQQFIADATEYGDVKANRALREKRGELDKAKARLGELDHLFRKLYEDNALGRLSDQQFTFMVSGYDDEKAALVEKIRGLEKEVSTVTERRDDVGRFVQIVRKYTDVQELSYEIVHEFIDRILVYELDKDTNTRKVEIYYSFVGQVDTGEAHTESVSFFRQIGADVKSYAV